MGAFADPLPLEDYLHSHPRSPWRLSLLTGLGTLAYKAGSFEAALARWNTVWQEGRELPDLAARNVVDLAVSERAMLLSKLGRQLELADLLEQVAGRDLRGPATQKIGTAIEGLVSMQSDPGNSFRCGPHALSNVLRALNSPLATDRRIDALRSSSCGTSLADIHDLAGELGMEMMGARREVEGPIPVPSVMHWRAGHFAAIVEEVADDRGLRRYRIEDPTFGDTLWVTSAALQRESSGAFLVAASRLTDGLAPLTDAEMREIRGKGVVSGRRNFCLDCCGPGGGGPGAGPSGGPTGGQGGPPGIGGGGGGSGGSGAGPGGPGGPRDKLICSCGGCYSVGMPHYRFNLLLTSLRIDDTPFSLPTLFGPAMDFSISYNQKDGFQPATFDYSNLGPKWTFNWLAYIEDNPATATTENHSVKLYKRGGGIEELVGYYQDQFIVSWKDRALVTYFPQEEASYYERDLPDGSKEIYSYALEYSGTERRVLLTGVIDPQGNYVTLNYDLEVAGRLSYVEDMLGRTIVFLYDDEENWPYRVTGVESTSSAGTRTATIGYGEDDRLSSVTDTIGMTSTFEYGDDDFVESMTTPYGTTTFEYEPPPTTWHHGIIEWLVATDPLNQSERIEYRADAPNIIAASESDAPDDVENTYLQLNNAIYWSKSAWGWHSSSPDEERYAHGHIYHFALWGSGVVSESVLSERPPLESRIWYRHAGRTVWVGTSMAPSAIVRQVPTDTGTATQQWEFERDNRDRLLSRTDPMGRLTTFTYDSNGIDLLHVSQKTGTQTFDVIAQYGDYDRHLPGSYIDAAGEETLFHYNGYGQLDSILNPRLEETTFDYSYSGSDVSLEITRPLGWSMTVDFDPFLRPHLITDADGDEFELTHDALDRLTNLEYLSDNTSYHYTWDRLDLESITNRLNHMWTMNYDALGRLESIFDPRSTSYANQFTYYPDNGLATLTDARMNGTIWHRDSRGKLTYKQRQDSSTSYYHYDDAGRLSYMVDPLGQEIHLGYALDNAIISKSYESEVTELPNTPETADVEIEYDPWYPRPVAYTANGVTTDLSYHPVGNPGALRLSAESTEGNSISHSYDQLGRISRETLLEDHHYDLAYDELGRVNSTSSPLGETYIDHDGVSARPESILQPNGLQTSFEYATGLPRYLKDIHIQRESPLADLHSFNYVRDLENRLLEMTETDAGHDVFEHDDAGQLTSVAPYGTPTQATEWVFDEAGNRISEEVSGVPSLSFQYDEMNQLDVVENQSGPERELSYDDNGNCVSNDPHADTPTEYVWDAEDRLIAIQKDSSRTTFEYDALGRRIGMVVDDGTNPPVETRYAWCGSRICAEYDESSSIYKLYYPEGEYTTGGEPVARYYSRDQMGSIVYVTDNEQSVMAYNKYDAWGNEVAHSGSEDAAFGFAGYHAFRGADRVPDLYLTWYRAYDPSLGRWLSRDPIGEAGGINLYGYVGNRPLDATDALGLAWGLNDSGRPMRYKPEHEEDGPVQLCMPGQECDVDGIYPEGGGYPVKIVDGCVWYLGDDGRLAIICDNEFNRVVQDLNGGKTEYTFHKWYPNWLTPSDSVAECGKN